LSIWDAKAPLLLLHRSLEALPDLPRYDLMLSPQFYVSKREELPLKYPFQAKKLAPSILDDLTGEGEFVYEVFRDKDGTWVFVAYDQDALTRFVEIKGGSPDRIGRIYFAEQVRERFEPPVALSPTEALGVVNGIATVIPTQLLSDPDRLGTFDDTFRPQQSFGIKRTRANSLLDTKTAVAIATVLGVLGLGYVAEGIRYARAAGSFESSLQSLQEANPSLAGSYARKSIYTKYTQTDTTQRAMRERLKAIGRLTSKETKIDRLSIDPKGYKATLAIPNDPKTVLSLKKLAQTGRLKQVNITPGKLETAGGLQ
jgi:hypothetical protein